MIHTSSTTSRKLLSLGAHEASARNTLARARAMRRLGIVTVIAAPVIAVVSYLLLTGLSSVEITRGTVLATIIVNGVMLMLLISTIIFELTRVRSERGETTSGSRLHWRIIGWFGLLAVIPALAVAVVAFVALDRRLDYWFSSKTRAIIETSGEVAEAYVTEHAKILRGDLIAMSLDLDRARSTYEINPGQFGQYLRTQATLRGLPAAFLLDDSGQVLIESLNEPGLQVFMPTRLAITRGGGGAPVIIAPGTTDQIGALIKLPDFDNAYLYIARKMDSQVVAYRRLILENAKEYSALEQQSSFVQNAFAVTYALLTLIMLLAAIWVGVVFADWLAAPIRRLMWAARQVSGGNLDVRVPEAQVGDDLGDLARAFNTMTEDLGYQRNELLAASAQIDQRRRFMEAVLTSVSAGVLGVDHDGTIILANTSICDILGRRRRDLEGADIVAAIPELAPLVQPGSSAWRAPAQVNFRRGDEDRILTVRLTDESGRDVRHRFVVTVDDITGLVAAQRTSAWADVARRIAHEIKNPLTPIQLSAERLKRRYGKDIGDGREVFDKCTDTIIRQVQDIGRMVDEFSSFARMPKAQMARDDILDVIRQSIFMMRVGYPDIDFRLSRRIEAQQPMMAVFDRRLIAQALTNLLKNATESIRRCTEAKTEKGCIEVDLYEDNGRIVIDVLDNGVGLPKKNRKRLLEPYMTTREKGTGLGLAIVNRIMEEHGGTVELDDRGAQPGACVRLVLGTLDSTDGARDRNGAATTRSPPR